MSKAIVWKCGFGLLMVLVIAVAAACGEDSGTDSSSEENEPEPVGTCAEVCETAAEACAEIASSCEDNCVASQWSEATRRCLQRAPNCEAADACYTDDGDAEATAFDYTSCQDQGGACPHGACDDDQFFEDETCDTYESDGFDISNPEGNCGAASGSYCINAAGDLGDSHYWVVDCAQHPVAEKCDIGCISSNGAAYQCINYGPTNNIPGHAGRGHVIRCAELADGHCPFGECNEGFGAGDDASDCSAYDANEFDVREATDNCPSDDAAYGITVEYGSGESVIEERYTVRCQESAEPNHCGSGYTLNSERGGYFCIKPVE